MGDVTVRIQGVGSGGAGGSSTPSSNNPPTPPSGTAGSGGAAGSASISSTDNRMVEDLRRAILSYGAVYVPTNNAFKPILQTVEQQQRKAVDEDVSKKYEDRRWQVYGKRDEVIEQELKKGSSDEVIAKAVKTYDDELDVIDREESEEKKEKQDQLTDALKELTDAINKSGSLNPDSYLGQLRKQRQEAIFERDNAEDEESAREAAKRVQEIDQQIKDVTDGRAAPEEKKIDFGDRVLATMMGFDQLNKGIINKNIGSAIMGVGSTVTGMLGTSDETTAKTLAWLTPISGIASLLQEVGQRGDQMAGLAALIRNSPEFNGDISEARRNMYSRLWGYGEDYTGTSIYDMGLSVPDFAASAEKRISQRGMAQDGIIEAYFQEALERVFSLNRGSLGDAGKYDRYGMYATDAIADLVSRLERISGSGVTQGNYARVQEYLGLQQELMGNYMRFSDKPSALNVNRDLAAFASLDNYTVDSRTSGDIKAVQNQLINPQNDRMKAILYSVVEETMPEYNGESTRGRVDLIDQILNDPNYQGVIEKAYMEKLTSMYGGFDTPMGYMMIKNQLQAIESPERRKAIWEGFTSGQAGNIISGYETYSGDFGKMHSAKMDYSKDIKDYVGDINAAMTQLSDGVFNAVGFLNKIANKIETGIKVMAQ